MLPLLLILFATALMTRATNIAIHTIPSEYQNGPSEVRVLVPNRMETGNRYPVLYVAPVKATPKAAATAIEQARADDLANRFGLLCFTPSFVKMP